MTAATRLTFLTAATLMVAVPSGVAAAEPITAREAASLAQQGEILLLDVRTPQEWQETGVPAPAVLLNMHDADFLAQFDELVTQAAGRPVALICDAGERTGWLTGALEARGYRNLMDVVEGMGGSRHGPGWLERGLPLRSYTPVQPLPPLSWWQRWRLGRTPDWQNDR